MEENTPVEAVQPESIEGNVELLPNVQTEAPITGVEEAPELTPGPGTADVHGDILGI